MREVELHHGARTDVGLVREVNEDALLASPPVFVVADGMGGHEGGDVASRIVVEEFARLVGDDYDPRHGGELVSQALRESQRRIQEYGEQQAAGSLQEAPTADVPNRWYAVCSLLFGFSEKGRHGIRTA